MAPGSGPPSPALAHYTNDTDTLPNFELPALGETLGPPTHRELVRAAISVLCHTLQPERGKDFYPVVMTGLEERLEPLFQLGCVWEEDSVTGGVAQLDALYTGIDVSAEEEREREVFTQVLWDGYVLCRLMGQLMPRSIIWTNPYGRNEQWRGYWDGVPSDVKRFLRSAFWLAEDLFQDNDLICATSESLARVAKTIIFLVHSVNPNLISSRLFLRLRSGEEPHKPFMPTFDQLTFGHAPVSPPLSNQSTTNHSPIPFNHGSTPSDQSLPNEPTSDKWFSNKPSSPPSNQSPPPIQRSSQLLSPNSLPPGYPSPLGYQSPPGYQTLPEDQLPPMYQLTMNQPPTDKSLNKLLSSLWPLEKATLNKSITSSNFTYSSTNSSDSELADMGTKRDDAAFDESRITPTVSTETILFVPNEPPSETVTDMSTVAFHPMAVDRANGFVGDDGDPNANVRIVLSPSQHEYSSEDLALPRERKTGGTAPTEPPEVFEGGHHEHVNVGEGNSPGGFVDESVMVPAFKGALPRNLNSSGGDTRYEVPERVIQMETRESLISNLVLPSPVLVPPITSPRPNLSSSRLLGSADHTSSNERSTESKSVPIISPSPNLSSSRLLESADHTSSNERSTGSNSVSSPDLSSRPGSANGPMLQVLLPRRSRREIEQASARQRLRPKLNHVSGSALRLGRLERTVNFPIASEARQHGSTDLPRTLFVEVAGKARKEYQLSTLAQRGQYGSVFRAFDLNTSRMVTVKRVELKGLKKKEVARVMLEVDILKKLSHPNIIKYEGMVGDDRMLSIVFEYAENGSLGQTLKAFGKLDERLVASYVIKILNGLDYIHRNGVVHCGLKADSIITTRDGGVKLSEFGTSFRLREIEQTRPVIAGSPNWTAPEVIELSGISTKCDIWSLGCTVIELLTGRPPYADITNIVTVMFRIVEDDCPPIPRSFGDLLVAFLKECFHKDPGQRPSAEELLKHEWFKQYLRLDKDLPPGRRSPIRASVSPSASGLGLPPAQPNPTNKCEHTIVKLTFKQPINCRVCMEPLKKRAVLCLQCKLTAHSKCVARHPRKPLPPLKDRPGMRHPSGWAARIASYLGLTRIRIPKAQSTRYSQ